MFLVKKKESISESADNYRAGKYILVLKEKLGGQGDR